MAEINDLHQNAFRSMEIKSRSMALFFGVSLCCHFLFVAFVVLSPNFHLFKRKLQPPVMQVSLVHLPGGNPAPGPAAASPEPASPAPPAKQPPKETTKVPEPPKAVPVPEPQPQPEKKAPPVEPKKEFKEKISLKKETKKKDIPIEKPDETPPPKPPEPQPEKKEPPKPTESSESQISKALESMKQKVAKSGPPSSGVPGTGATGSGAGGVAGGTDRGGSVIGTLSQLYEQEVGYRVQLNWAFSSLEGIGGQKLEAVLGIKIAPNGEIQDIWFDKKSGNNRLDDSAFNAIRKSNPLPKLPQGEKEHIMGIRFTPQGVK